MLNFKDFIPDENTAPETVQPIPGQANLSIVDPIDVMIEGFVAEDFDREEPYLVCLKNHGDNEVRFQALQNKLKRQAERCKLKTGERSDYAKMKKAVFDAHPELLPKKRQGSAPVSTGFPDMTKFFGQEEVNYGKYVCSDNGVQATNMYGVPMTVCKQPIILTRRYNSLTNDGSETLDVAYYSDNRWNVLRQIPHKDLASSQNIVKILADKGVDVTTETAKDLVAFLNDFYFNNRHIIPQVNTVSKLGWTGDGEFVPFTGNVEFDAVSASSFQRMGQSLHNHGDQDTWIKGVNAIRKTRKSVPFRLMLAASFGSVLLKPMKKLPYWFHMVGNSSTGKTVSLRAAATIWGDAPSGGDGWMHTMKSTDVGLEQLAGFANNLPLCLDELQTIQDDRNFGQILYNFTAGHGKVRGARSGGLRDILTWCCGALSTGEEGIVTAEDHGGANTRVIQVKVADKLFDDPRGFCANVLDVSYGHAGKLFLEGLKQEDMEALLKKVNQRAARWFDDKRIADKQADSASVILLADELAEKYIFKDGVLLSEDDILPYLKSRDAIDDNQKAYEAFVDIITENQNNFYINNIEPRNKTWGKIENNGDRVLMLRKPLSEELAKRKIDMDRFIDWCLDKGVIVKHGGSGSTSYTTVQNIGALGKQRVIDFNMTVLRPSDDQDTSSNQNGVSGVSSVSGETKGFTDVTDDKYVQTELPF